MDAKGVRWRGSSQHSGKPHFVCVRVPINRATDRFLFGIYGRRSHTKLEDSDTSVTVGIASLCSFLLIFFSEGTDSRHDRST